MMHAVGRPLTAVLPGILALLLFLGAVELIVVTFQVSPIVLPRPTRIFDAFVSRLAIYPPHMAATAAEAVIGLALGAMAALALAVLITQIPLFRRAILPLIVAQQVLPTVVFAPIILVWFGYGITSKVVCAAITCFFPIMIASIHGLTTVPTEMVDYARSLGASRWRILRRIRIPSALPYFMNSMKTGATLALIGAIVGEFIGGNQGLGFLVVEALRFINLPAMFSATIVIIAVGLTLFGAVELLSRWLLKWQHVRQGHRS